MRCITLHPVGIKWSEELVRTALYDFRLVRICTAYRLTLGTRTFAVGSGRQH